MSSPAAMRYEEWPPPASLRSWLAAFWTFSVQEGEPAFDHQIPLTGGAILALNLLGGPLVLVGPRTAPLATKAMGGDRFAGLHLWPGTHRAWLGPGVPLLRDHRFPLKQLLDPSWVGGLEEALREMDSDHRWDRLEAILTGRGLPGILDPVVMASVARILQAQGRGAVSHLAATVGLSPSQWRRRFMASVELTPKALARIRRVRASATDAVSGGAWAAIAANRGYADQAHLVREFQDLLGLPPEAFRRKGDRIAHRLLGA